MPATGKRNGDDGMARCKRCKARETLEAIRWVLDNADDPFATPPSEQAEKLRSLWELKHRVFMVLWMLVHKEAEGLDSSYYREMFHLALVEARYELGRVR